MRTRTLMLRAAPPGGARPGPYRRGPAGDRPPAGAAPVILADDARVPGMPGRSAPRPTTRRPAAGKVLAMRTWTTTHTVAAQPDAVLAVLTDPDACRDWAPVAFDVELDPPARRAQLATGTRARVTGRLAGRPVGFEVEVDEATRDRLGPRRPPAGGVHVPAAPRAAGTRREGRAAGPGGPCAPPGGWRSTCSTTWRRGAPAARFGRRSPCAPAAACSAGWPPRPRTRSWAPASSTRPSPGSGARRQPADRDDAQGAR